MEQENFENQYSIKDLLHKYEGLRLGTNNSYLEEEDFEALCDYFEDQENLKKALEILEIGIINHAFSSSLKIRMADVFISMNNNFAADKMLDAAYLLDKLDTNYYILKFELNIKKHDIASAEKFISEGLPLFDNEDKIEILEEVVEILIEYFEHEKITKYLLDILQLDNTNEFALIEIPFWSQVSNQVEASIDFHLELIKTQPYNHLVWFNLGIGYQCLGLYEKSSEAYDFCLAINEQCELALRNNVSVLLKIKKYVKAIQCLDTLVDMTDRPESNVYAMLGLCYAANKNVEMAIKNYKAAISLDPKNADFYFVLSKIFYAESLDAEAIEYCKKAIAINHNDTNYNQLLGTIYFNHQQYKVALTYFFNSLVTKKRNIKLWGQYLQCFMLLKQYETGLESAEWAYKFTQNDLFIYFKIAFLLLANKETIAKELFDTLINKDKIKIRKVSKYCNAFNNCEWLVPFLPKK